MDLLVALLIFAIVAAVIIYIIQLLPLPATIKQIALVITGVIFLIVLLTRFVIPLIH